MELLLGICLGMQLLFSSSTEGSLNKGLDLIPGNCRPFTEQKLLKVRSLMWVLPLKL